MALCGRIRVSGGLSRRDVYIDLSVLPGSADELVVTSVDYVHGRVTSFRHCLVLIAVELLIRPVAATPYDDGLVVRADSDGRALLRPVSSR